MRKIEERGTEENKKERDKLRSRTPSSQNNSNKRQPSTVGAVLNISVVAEKEK